MAVVKVTVRLLRNLGFDQSWYDRSSKNHRVKCSCCYVVVIKGHPTHEKGCPNAKRS